MRVVHRSHYFYYLNVLHIQTTKNLSALEKQKGLYAYITTLSLSLISQSICFAGIGTIST
ncbi:ABC transporter, ATP-binding protein [Bacillus cereus]|nr:ABC transporter, ATP-binding protein [Bacillus cereus]